MNIAGFIQGARNAARVGANRFSAGPPQGKSAPSGGSVLHEVSSVGANICSV